MKPKILVKATVTGIGPLLTGRTGVEYKFVFFKMTDGKSLKTTVCPTHGNWKRWEPLLQEGVVLDKLEVIDEREGLVNGDSYPLLVFRPAKQQELL